MAVLRLDTLGLQELLAAATSKPGALSNGAEKTTNPQNTPKVTAVTMCLAKQLLDYLLCVCRPAACKESGGRTLTLSVCCRSCFHKKSYLMYCCLNSSQFLMVDRVTLSTWRPQNAQAHTQ